MDEMDAVFHALSHPARRDMLRRLAGGQCTVSELAAPFNMSFAASSKHVRVLEQAGLLHRQVKGREHVCTLAAAPLARASQWLGFYEQFWPASLDRLASLFTPGAEPGDGSSAGGDGSGR